MASSGHELNAYQPLFYVDHELHVRAARQLRAVIGNEMYAAEGVKLAHGPTVPAAPGLGNSPKRQPVTAA